MLTGNDRFWGEGARGHTRKQRGKKEIIVGTDNHLNLGEIRCGSEQSGGCTYDVVLRRVELLEETGGAPTTPEDNQSLLCWIVRKLWARSAFLVGDIVEASPGDDHGADSQSADCLESSSPPRHPNLTG